MIGGNHGHLAAALVPELLSTHPFFMTAEPDVDDPACILSCHHDFLPYIAGWLCQGEVWQFHVASHSYLPSS